MIISGPEIFDWVPEEQKRQIREFFAGIQEIREKIKHVDISRDFNRRNREDNPLNLNY
jgi:hypothetical protein